MAQGELGGLQAKFAADERAGGMAELMWMPAVLPPPRSNAFFLTGMDPNSQADRENR